MKTYETRIDTFDLGSWGTIKFNQWLHGAPQFFNEASVNAVSRLVPPGSFAIDIGAYTGDTAIPMSLAAGKNGRVLAFEPGPAAFPLLVDNLDLNDIRNTDPIQRAVMTEDGGYTFHYVDEGYINGGYSYGVKAGPEGCGNYYEARVVGVNLPAYLRDIYSLWLPKLSFIKIDAEGYDRVIIRSCGEILRKYRPALEVEVYPFLNTEERKELMLAIKDAGYYWSVSDSQFFLEPPIVTNVLCLPN